jgi:hypothetical protein
MRLRILLAWLAVLRTNEAMDATFGSDSFKLPGAPPGHLLFAIHTAKNHRNTTRWVPLRITGPGRLSFQNAWQAHGQLLRERGIVIGPFTPLFGLAGNPLQALKSAAVIYDTAHFKTGIIEPTLTRMQRKELLTEKWVGYSFRRGGINALLREAQAAGYAPEDLITYLMVRGRWRSASAAYTYLVDVDPALAEHFKLLMRATGAQLNKRIAKRTDLVSLDDA